MNESDYDASFIAEALPAFVSEAHEHIGMLEQLLLQLETEPNNRELLDALFRCAHTVKGSAGIFGLERIVAFTHHVETLLDQLREGRRALTPELSTLLLQCNDQIRVLVEAAQDAALDTPDALQTREALVQRLRAVYEGGSAGGGEGAVARDAPAAPPDRAEPAADGPTTRRWQVAVRFGPDTYRNGMDPLAILNYVRGLGQVSELTCDTAVVPDLDTIDPEACHLGFEFSLDTAAERAQIESAFSFVRDDCTLQVLEAGVAAVPEAVAAPATPGTAPAPAPAGPTAAPQQPERGRDVAPKAAASEDNRFIRVHADRLDHVINLLGELVIAGAGAALLARQSRQDTLIEATQQISGLVEEIRNGTLQLRMVPIGETFARFRRVVRDTAAELGKDIALDIVGGETELDKSVVERIADPLMHLVRNALDHGLETPEERLQAGKPSQGRLTLSACHESGSIFLRIVDDGRGINRERVLARAWERGLIERDVVPPDAQILALIFEPGFSTAEKVTNLSGRGVGMDVVRRNIQALRGTVELASEPGKGSCIEIRLPLTLAIIDGFLIGVGPSKFIFPLDTVIEVIESQATPDAAAVPAASVVELRGHVLPVVDLRSLYELDSPPPERSSVVVIQSGTVRCGVKVDQLLGQHQTVIKPLGRMFKGLRGISGSSILGNGEVALIFDVNALAELASALPPSFARDQAVT